MRSKGPQDIRPSRKPRGRRRRSPHAREKAEADDALPGSRPDDPSPACELRRRADWALLLLLLAGASPAFAGAWWRLSSRAAPTFLVPGKKATIIVAATNVGDAGVNALERAGERSRTRCPRAWKRPRSRALRRSRKSKKAQQMTCELKTLSCASSAETLPPFQALDVAIQVNVKPGAEHRRTERGERRKAVNRKAKPERRDARCFGQRAAYGQGRNRRRLASKKAAIRSRPKQKAVRLTREAGSHPFQLTTTLDLNQTIESVAGSDLVAAAPALPKNLELQPAARPDRRPACSASPVRASTFSRSAKSTNACKPESAIGVVVVTLDEPSQLSLHHPRGSVVESGTGPRRARPVRLRGPHGPRRAGYLRAHRRRLRRDRQRQQRPRGRANPRQRSHDLGSTRRPEPRPVAGMDMRARRRLL